MLFSGILNKSPSCGRESCMKIKCIAVLDPSVAWDNNLKDLPLRKGDCRSEGCHLVLLCRCVVFFMLMRKCLTTNLLEEDSLLW